VADWERMAADPQTLAAYRDETDLAGFDAPLPEH